jgi:excisionase family DNA binding protein
MAAIPDDPVLTAAEVASWLRISYKNCLRLLNSRAIHGIRTGEGSRSEWRVATSEVKRYLTERPIRLAG